MNLVEPIRDLNKIEEMKKVLLEQGKGKRNYLIFKVGINIGIRVSDIIKLKVSDIRYENGTMRDDITIIEKKTNKKKTFRFNIELKKELEDYTKQMQHNNMSIFLKVGKELINLLRARKYIDFLMMQQKWLVSLIV